MDYSKLTDAELDEMAAECMGWQKANGWYGNHYGPIWERSAVRIVQAADWHPSTVPADTFRFMEHALADGFIVGVMKIPDGMGEISGNHRVSVRKGEHSIIWYFNVPTLSRAITEAIVAAYKAEEETK